MGRNVSAMTPEEIRTAEDFERGWSDERIRSAEVSWGPGLVDMLPPALAERVQARARKEGTSDLSVIEAALSQYLDNSAA